MSDLTEAEIFDCMAENLRLALESCRALAKSPKKGQHYWEFRERMRLVEGSCRQASAWRENTGWLDLGNKIHEALRRAGEWLRGVEIEITIPSKDGFPERVVKMRKPPEDGKLHPCFMILGDLLEAMLVNAMRMKDAAHGRVGMILPEMPNLGRRVGAPVHFTTPKGMHRSATSGLVVPDGAVAQ
jgi:hypothetical protein